MSGFRIELDQDECLSSGKCIVDQPSAFGFDDEELVVGLPGLADLTDDQLVASARRCPSGAIRVFDGDTEVET